MQIRTEPMEIATAPATEVHTRIQEGSAKPEPRTLPSSAVTAKPRKQRPAIVESYIIHGFNVRYAGRLCGLPIFRHLCLNGAK